MPFGRSIGLAVSGKIMRGLQKKFGTLDTEVTLEKVCFARIVGIRLHDDVVLAWGKHMHHIPLLANADFSAATLFTTN